MKLNNAFFFLLLVLTCCGLINGERGNKETTTAKSGRQTTTTKDPWNRLSTAEEEEDDSGRFTKSIEQTTTSEATSTTSAATETESTSTPEIGTSSIPYVRPNISSYEEAVVITLTTRFSVDIAQSVIYNEFDALFISYCQNISCGYAPTSDTDTPNIRLPFYLVLYLESSVNNVQETINFTLSVLYRGDFIPDFILTDFFKTATNSFTAITILRSVTYSDATRPPSVAVNECEETSGYIAAIVVLSILSGGLLIGIIVLAMKQSKRSSYSNYDDGKNLTSVDNERSHIDRQSNTYH